MDLEQQARRVATAVREAGGRALCVGGFVRDRIIGRASKDLDVEVFGIPQDQLLPLLKSLGPSTSLGTSRVEPVGQAFPVYKLGAIDVALPRRESKTGRGHKGFTVEGDPSMPFEEAARRRDFTINAIGWDPLTDEYLDPFGGRKDLALRVLRICDRVTFGDDSLRVLRALQFAARFDLTLDPETARICSAIALDDLPAERIWGEFEKLLLQAERPSIGFWACGVAGTGAVFCYALLSGAGASQVHWADLLLAGDREVVAHHVGDLIPRQLIINDRHRN